MRFGRRRLPILVAVVIALIAVPALAAVPLTRVSTDPYTNAASQHRTEVEPDTFSFGSTIISAFQVGRVFGGGSANIGWARSADSGATWTNGFLPGTTTVASPPGSFSAISDPAVAFDARHNVWLISSLGIRSNGTNQVVTSRSTNGGLTWSNPVATSTTGNPDKNWIACDNTTSSPFYGNCYTEWDNTADGNRIKLQTSSNGGLSWGPARNSGDNATGLGGQPVVRPNGTVLVPMNNANQSQIRSFRSIDGGASWRATVLVSSISRHTVAGGLRTSPLPSAEIDAAGTAYVVWQDCRFRSGCTSNDIVHEQVDQRDHLGAGHPGADRRHLQHRGPLHPRHRGGPLHLGRQHPHRPDLLLLSNRGLHLDHLPAERRLHLLDQRRHQLEHSDQRDRPDGAVLVGQHLPGPHGRRLHLHLGASRRTGLADHRGRHRAHRGTVQRGHERAHRGTANQRWDSKGLDRRRGRRRTDPGRQASTRRHPPLATDARPRELSASRCRSRWPARRARPTGP